MSKDIELLVVDDSRIFRAAVEEALKTETDIHVAGSVMNGAKALDFIKSSPPDVVTLDVEMPVMDGLETLKAINEFNSSHPDRPDIGVIMLSSHTHKGADITIKALESGAFDFISKPESSDVQASIGMLRDKLLVKLRHFALKQNGSPGPKPRTTRKAPAKAGRRRRFISRPRAVVIGVSTGGPKALCAMLPDLCDKVSLPVFIVQHMPPIFTQSLARSLDSRCSHTVVEADEGMEVEKKHVYVAPGGKHMVVRGNLTGPVRTALTDQPLENGCRPSVDVLFRSAAAVYKGEVIAVVLTGMGADGTRGLGPLKRSGAFVVAQDEETSVVWGMPGNAVASGAVDEVLPLQQIPEAVATAATSAIK